MGGDGDFIEVVLEGFGAGVEIAACGERWAISLDDDATMVRAGSTEVRAGSIGVRTGERTAITGGVFAIPGFEMAAAVGLTPGPPLKLTLCALRAPIFLS